MNTYGDPMGQRWQQPCWNEGGGHVNWEHRSISSNPAPRRVIFRAYAIALGVHAIVLLAVIVAQRSAGAHSGADVRQPRIGAFVQGVPAPTGTSGVTKPAEKAHAPTPTSPREGPSPPRSAAPEPAGSGSARSAGSQTDQSSQPVRFGSGEGLGLIKKVNPVYPPTMEAARQEGTVVLDAVIHRDGTIGDIKIVRSPSSEFERAAIAAVKQWRYSPLPVEGIVTVTINFTLPR
jgi:TonB family protein